MPNRIIKETICSSRGLASCSIFSQDLYKRLITYADDYGRFNADTEIMLARLYPRETDVITQFDINEALVELSGIGKIEFYTSTPRKDIYAAFPNWNEHQRVRDSKKKMPDPTDTSINDWYLRRFVSLEMKIAILEESKFKCGSCGKNLNPFELDAKNLIKMNTGAIHFDHIVPVNQGGRATFENLRVTCPSCNLKRKKTFTFNEILNFAVNCGEDKEFAASCGEFPPNPIQSLSESESLSESLSESISCEQSSRGKQIPYQEIIDLYHSLCPSLPRVKILSEGRKRLIKARWKEVDGDLNAFETIFSNVGRSDFLSGRNNKWTGCNIDWILKQDKFIKIGEGTYNDKSGTDNVFLDMLQRGDY